MCLCAAFYIIIATKHWIKLALVVVVATVYHFRQIPVAYWTDPNDQKSINERFVFVSGVKVTLLPTKFHQLSGQESHSVASKLSLVRKAQHNQCWKFCGENSLPETHLTHYEPLLKQTNHRLPWLYSSEPYNPSLTTPKGNGVKNAPTLNPCFYTIFFFTQGHLKKPLFFL